jgi:hypothetical protein
MLLQSVLNTTQDDTQELRYLEISHSLFTSRLKPENKQNTHEAVTKPPSPPNSPDLADSVSHFFGVLKVAVREKRFRSDLEIIAEVAAGTKSKCVQEGDSCPRARLAQGCQVYGDYVEK